MKRTGVLLAFVLLSGVAAFANSNSDPRIIIKDPVCEKSCTHVGTHFSFTSPVSGSGTLVFLNASEVNWHNLDLVESVVPANLITCSTNAFIRCSVTTVGGITSIFASGLGGIFKGIPAGRAFDITFDGWPVGGVSFTATANVPEPATLALLTTGLAAIVTRRRKLLR